MSVFRCGMILAHSRSDSPALTSRLRLGLRLPLPMISKGVLVSDRVLCISRNSKIRSTTHTIAPRFLCCNCLCKLSLRDMSTRLPARAAGGIPTLRDRVASAQVSRPAKPHRHVHAAAGQPGLHQPQLPSPSTGTPAARTGTTTACQSTLSRKLWPALRQRSAVALTCTMCVNPHWDDNVSLGLLPRLGPECGLPPQAHPRLRSMVGQSLHIASLSS